MKLKILIIGSSKIIEEHIKSALNNNIGLYSLNSTKKKSYNEVRLKKKFKFERNFKNWDLALKSIQNRKDIIIFLAPRIKDNFRILKRCLKNNNYIFTEKPISKNLNELKNLKKHNKRIFVGYNRLYYKSVNYLKKNLLNPSSVIVKFTEKNINEISSNSVHIFSIIFYLFGNLKIRQKYRYKQSISLFTVNENGLPIYFQFSKQSPETFSIDINSKKKRYLLKPIENLIIYKKLNKRYLGGNKKFLIPSEIPYLKINDYSNTKYKPGFTNQIITLKKFAQNKSKIFNNISLAIKVINFANQFIKN
jgi:hypothetical protein